MLLRALRIHISIVKVRLTHIWKASEIQPHQSAGEDASRRLRLAFKTQILRSKDLGKSFHRQIFTLRNTPGHCFVHPSCSFSLLIVGGLLLVKCLRIRWTFEAVSSRSATGVQGSLFFLDLENRASFWPKRVPLYDQFWLTLLTS